MSFKGVIPPIITPFHQDGSIDRAGFETVLEHLIAAGVHGVVIGGTTGEYYAQSRDERVGLLKLAAKIAHGRVPLIAGVGAIRTEDCIEYALIARDLKYDGILIGSPYYAVPTQLELANHALARDYPHIDLFCGMDDQALEFFVWGARGWVCGAGNCLPEEHLALYNACVVEQDFAKGRLIMSALLPLMRVLEQGGKFVQAIKYGCELAGLPAGPVRKPMRGLEEEEQRELANTIRTLKAVIASIDKKSIKKVAQNVVALNA